MFRLVFIFLLIFPVWVSAQGKYGNNWVFPDYLGLDFNHTPLPLVTNSSIFGPNIPNTSISNQQGQLECYVGTWAYADFDVRLFNRFHTLVKNGDKLHQMVNGNYTQYTGSVLLLNFGSSTDSVMLVQNSPNYAAGSYAIHYSLIDNRSHQDTGNIYSLNNKVLDYKSRFGIAGIRHANGRDWWVLTHGFPNNWFYIFLAQPWSLELYATQQIGSTHGKNDTTYVSGGALGEMSASLNGDRILITNKEGLAEVFDFDRCTGQLSNPITLLSVPPPGTYVNIFSGNLSPGGRFAYLISTFDNGLSVADMRMVQHDLQSGNPALDSVHIVTSSSNTIFLDQLEFGPDGRMWFTGRTQNKGNLLYPQDSFLHFIENPDIKGIGCNVKFNQLYLNGRIATSGMPNMPNYNLGPVDGSLCDTLGLDAVGVEEYSVRNPGDFYVYPNPARGSARLHLADDHILYEIRIRDVLGREIFSENFMGEIFTIGDLPGKGIYYITVSGASQFWSASFLIH